MNSQGVLGEILPFYKVGDLATSSDDRYMEHGRHQTQVSYDTASQLHSHIVPTGAVGYAKIGLGSSILESTTRCDRGLLYR